MHVWIVQVKNVHDEWVVCDIVAGGLSKDEAIRVALYENGYEGDDMARAFKANVLGVE